MGINFWCHRRVWAFVNVGWVLWMGSSPCIITVVWVLGSATQSSSLCMSSYSLLVGEGLPHASLSVGEGLPHASLSVGEGLPHASLSVGEGLPRASLTDMERRLVPMVGMGVGKGGKGWVRSSPTCCHHGWVVAPPYSHRCPHMQVHHRCWCVTAHGCCP